MRVPSCSSLSSAEGESLAATASQVGRWVLIEDPGPWGYDALIQNRVPSGMLDDIKAWSDAIGARLVLIRRGPRKRGAARAIYIASSVPERRWVRKLSTDDLEALLTVGRDAFGIGADLPGDPVESLYLVCTHGRHDRCCSVRGNPVARALCAELGDAAWECSHIGGDRFAANVVCLPRGAYFGRVTAADAPRLISDYADGLLDLECFRGWSAYPFAVQAAEIAARRQLGLTGIDDVAPRSWHKASPTQVDVSLAVEGRVIEASVELRRSSEEYYLTCRAQETGRPLLFEVTI